MSSTLVTVVIPTYNYGVFLEGAIRSAASQSYPHIEIIVVDDGSTDDTQAILLRLEAEISNLHNIKTAHLGVSNARNVGTKAARGTYVAYLDADDLWHPSKIAKQVAAIEAHGGDPEWAAVYCLFRTVDRHGRLIGSAPAFETRGYCFASHLIVNHLGNGSSLMVRKDIALAVGGFNPAYSLCEDIDFQLRILRHYKLELVREYLVAYRNHKGSATKNHVKMAEAFTDTMKRHTSDPQIPQELRKAAMQAAHRYVWNKYTRGGQHLKGWLTLLKAIIGEPRQTFADLANLTDGYIRRRIRRRFPSATQTLEFEKPPFLSVSPVYGLPLEEPPYQARISAQFQKYDEYLYKRFVSSECFDANERKVENEKQGVI